MKRTTQSITALGILLCSTLNMNAGGAKSAAIGIGSGMAGFMLGTAVASQNNTHYADYDYGYYEPAPRYVERETVYVQQPARTVTVQCPHMQRDLRNAQEQLAQERSRRQTAEARLQEANARIAQLEASLARTNRTNDIVVAENTRLQAELTSVRTPKVTVVTTGHQCNSGSCTVNKSYTPGVQRVEVQGKEQY